MDPTADATREAAEGPARAEGASSGAAAIAGLAAALAGCADTGDEAAAAADASPLHVAYAANDHVPTRTLLGAGRAQATAAPGAMPSAGELMDWAERAYPEFFPDHRADQVESPFTFRHYPASGNYLGVAGTEVYVLGPVSGGAILRVGSLADFAPAVQASLRPAGDEAAARFLLQAQFSARPAEIAQVRALGYVAWLDTQMAMPLGQGAWDWMVANGFGAIDDRALYDVGAHTVESALAWQVANADDVMRKRVALALSEFFVVSTQVAQMPWTGLAMAHYWDQLNEHAFGNFRQLLEAMTLNPAMGAWLNTRGNLKEDAANGRVPDENYAREVMQLFTIGPILLNLGGSPQRDAAGQPRASYTQDDVTQLARIFTGWDWWDDGRRFIAPATNNGRPYPEYTRRAMTWESGKHSVRASTVLGATVAAGGDGPRRLGQALDILFRHPNVGPFFSRQMIQRLVSSHPSPGYVARVAAKFNDNGQGVRGDLKAVWRAILLDDEARGDGGLGSLTHGKLREPMVRVYQWLRSFDCQSRSGQWQLNPPVGDPLLWYGQRPLSSPSVFNFFRPGYVPPGTAMAAMNATAPEFQIVNESSVSQWLNYIDSLNLTAGVPSAGAWFDIRTDFVREKPLAGDLPALVRHLNLLLAAGQLSTATQQRIADIVLLSGAVQPGDSDDFHRYRVIAAVTLVMGCAEYLVQK